MLASPPAVVEAVTATDLDKKLPVTECPLSHRVARRFFSSMILLLLILIAASLVYVFLIQRQSA